MAVVFTTLRDMWLRMMMATLAVDTSLFFLCGLFATVKRITGPKATRSPRWAAAVVVAPILGVISAVALGAVPSVLIAAMYVNVPADMPEWQAWSWGCFLGVFIALVNAGAFQRIV